ncbi:MAG: outer membrane protein OmpA-like peptidoglycan-associated protein [Saprospiraceae bacterium]|jgi:outer membrane protein OmpA-like peptidoglycan-associated protein
MSKLLLPSLCICLTIWLFGGSVWFGNQFSRSIIDASWQLRDGATSFHCPTTFSFQTSDAEVILDDNQLDMISRIAQYMKTNPTRNLELTGVYTEEETKNIDIKNLGFARAECFQQLIYRKGIDLARIEVSGKLLKTHQLNANGLIHGGVDFTFIESPLVKYGPAFSTIKTISFEDQSEEIISTDDFEAYVAAIRQYLTDHPDKHLQLTGYSHSVNQNTMTQKRVLSLKNLLTKNEIPLEKLKAAIDRNSIRQSESSYVEIRVL